ncbi:MAG: hypothetical protein GY749_37850 [Desulfobacteraceae bacterium]|nr:hypothetical protein [Desulfobacteraceae bacterium]
MDELKNTVALLTSHFSLLTSLTSLTSHFSHFSHFSLLTSHFSLRRCVWKFY